jgi:hypothetical protein
MLRPAYAYVNLSDFRKELKRRVLRQDLSSLFYTKFDSGVVDTRTHLQLDDGWSCVTFGIYDPKQAYCWWCYRNIPVHEELKKAQQTPPNQFCFQSHLSI